MMKPNELTPSDAPAAFRCQVRLADASAFDQKVAADLTQAATNAMHIAARRAERLGALVVAVANRTGRIRDLSTVLTAAARRDKDAVAMAALGGSPSPTKSDVK